MYLLKNTHGFNTQGFLGVMTRKQRFWWSKTWANFALPTSLYQLRFKRRPQEFPREWFRCTEAGMLRRVSTVLVVTAALASSGMAVATEPQWPLGPYKYMVIDQDLKG